MEAIASTISCPACSDSLVWLDCYLVDKIHTWYACTMLCLRFFVTAVRCVTCETGVGGGDRYFSSIISDNNMITVMGGDYRK